MSPFLRVLSGVVWPPVTSFANAHESTQWASNFSESLFLLFFKPSTSRICSMAQSISSFSMTRGGANRMTVSWVSLHRSPFSINRSQ